MIQAAKSVRRIVTGMTTATTMDSRHPIENKTNATMETVASARWNKSSLAFSSAVSP